jgi:hypothetical protein
MTRDAQRTAATALMPFDGGISTDVASNRKRNRFLFLAAAKWPKNSDFA